MTIVNNYVSKLTFTDTTESFSIITYIDIDAIVEPSFIQDYVNKLVEKNSILKKTENEQKTFWFIYSRIYKKLCGNYY